MTLIVQGGFMFYDSVGNELKLGDVLRVFHFVNSYKRRKEFMYKQVGEISPNGHRIHILHLPVSEKRSGYWVLPEELTNCVVVQRNKYEEKNLKRSRELRD